MITLYQNWLIRMNKTSGDWKWWGVCFFGLIIMLGWMAFALPYIGVGTGWEWLAEVSHLPNGDSTLTIYQWIKFEGKAADYYLLAALLGIAIAKVGQIFFELGRNYGNGLRYSPPTTVQPWGSWK